MCGVTSRGLKKTQTAPCHSSSSAQSPLRRLVTLPNDHEIDTWYSAYVARRRGDKKRAAKRSRIRTKLIQYAKAYVAVARLCASKPLWLSLEPDESTDRFTDVPGSYGTTKKPSKMKKPTGKRTTKRRHRKNR